MDKKKYYNKYYFKNKDRINGQRKQRAIGNKDKIKEYFKQYNFKNKERINKTRRGYYLKHKSKHKKYYKKYRFENKNKYKEYQLIREYNINFEQFNHMRILQDNKCVICDNLFKNNKDCHIDHNHLTGQVRQLLCKKCNIALGLLSEDINILEKAINYLRKWK